MDEPTTDDEPNGSDGHWIHCGVCGCALKLHVDRYELRLWCPECGRSFEFGTEPPGGAVEGLPPFVAERVGVES